MKKKNFIAKDYGQDDNFREEIKNWLNDIWLEKDKYLN